MKGFCLEPQDQYMDVLHEVYKLKEFQALQYHPHLVGLFARHVEGDHYPSSEIDWTRDLSATRRIHDPTAPGLYSHPRERQDLKLRRGFP